MSGPTAPTDQQSLIEGLISVESVLSSQSRKVYAVYVDRGADESLFRHLKELLGDVPVETCSRNALDAMATGRSHGGILAKVGTRRFVSLPDLLPSQGAAFIAMLDGIEDPFNFGQAVRALYAAGCDGMVVRPRNWTNAAGTVARASAGASELMPMADAESLDQAAIWFAERGLIVVATAENRDATPLHNVDLTRPLFLLIGGERRGVQRSFLSMAEQVINIPYTRPFGRSLGTVAATAVVAFEIARQRKDAKEGI